jgi:hypothetical protein
VKGEKGETMTTMTFDVEKMGESMLELLKREHEYLLELQRLSEEQSVLVSNGQSEELLHLLARRQRLVDLIVKTHVESNHYRQKWMEIKDTLSEKTRKPISLLLENIHQMLNGILEHDRKDCEALSASKKQVAGEINTTNTVQAATSYYTGTTKTGHRNSPGGNFQITG